jgi:tRNA(Ile)-lysidine synthase TilS/MesJ
LHVVVKEFGLKPLAVTFNHNWFSKTGWYNLQNALEKMDIDHVMFTPSRSLVNRIAKRSLETIGDACWHCHMGVSSFIIKMAVAYKIPLLVWGESTAEHGRATYLKPDKFDRDYFLRVSARLTPEKFACDYLSMKDLFPFMTPSAEECEAIGLNGIHLGDYIPWDTEKQVSFIKETYGWKGTAIEGQYKDYKSAECSMAGMHDFMCYCKRGFGRASIQASGEIREGTLSKQFGGLNWMLDTERMRPASLDYYLEITGMSEMEFYEAIAKLQHPKIKGKHIPIIKNTRDIPEAGKPFVQRLIDGEV